MRRRATIAFALLVLGGCADPPTRPFPDADPVWVDPDTRPFPGPPPERYISYLWDGADNTVFRPLAEAVTPETPSEAVNVNAFDEVPGSSWYENRLAVREQSAEEIARGACPEGADEGLPTPLTVVSGKPDGSSRGVTVADASGRRHLLKPDGPLQPERPSAADAIAAGIWHAAGFHVPCNRVVYLRRDDLEVAPDATVERTDGTERSLTAEDVERVLEHAVRAEDGRYRLAASQFVAGEPRDHWRYRGVRAGDPNDVVPHEDRRELRAQYVLSAWTSHIDARAENTLTSWMPSGDGRGHLRHYMLDFGDTFGVIVESETLSKRFGHSHYLDIEHLVVDLVTLGQIDRPWDDAAYGPAGRTLGYFDAADFEPDEWRPGYPNPAYDRMTEADAAWMARIVARFDDDDVRALVARGRFSDEIVTEELARILIERRDRILERWLTVLSPLAWPRVETSGGAPRLCAQDLALRSGIRNADGRRHRTRAWAGLALTPLDVEEGPVLGGDATVCQPLPSVDADYLVLDVVAESEGAETTFPLRAHLRPTADGWRLVGLERPASAEAPARIVAAVDDRAERSAPSARQPHPKALDGDYAPGERRPVPDYDGRPPAPPTPGDRIEGLARGVMRPVRSAIDVFVRRPFGALVARIERSEAVRRWSADR